MKLKIEVEISDFAVPAEVSKQIVRAIGSVGLYEVKIEDESGRLLVSND